MTKLLQKAFKEISKLPSIEQDAWAKLLLEELEAERTWAKLFAETEDVMARLAEEALEEHRQGKTKPLREVIANEDEQDL